MPTANPPIVVLGAGPAGCAAAIAAASSGASVLLIEKGAPSKDKACGDAWLPRAVEELRALGVDLCGLDPAAKRFADLSGRFAEMEVWSQRLAPFEGVIARRTRVDQGLRDLAQASGCVLWHGAEAKRLRLDGRRIEVTLQRDGRTMILHASALVLATGGGCRLARQTGLNGAPGFGAAVSGYARGAAGMASPTFLFDDVSLGYSWIFPLDSNASNAGVFALSRDCASGLRARMNRLLAELEVSETARLRGGVLPLWSGEGTGWSHAGVVSCGDAAGLVDPLSGEGLTAALVSGRQAGEAVASLLAGRHGAMMRYDGWLRDWARKRYQPSLENRTFAAWVGLAPAERRLFEIMLGL